MFTRTLYIHPHICLYTYVCIYPHTELNVLIVGIKGGKFKFTPGGFPFFVVKEVRHLLRDGAELSVMRTNVMV